MTTDRDQSSSANQVYPNDPIKSRNKVLRINIFWWVSVYYSKSIIWSTSHILIGLRLKLKAVILPDLDLALESSMPFQYVITGAHYVQMENPPHLQNVLLPIVHLREPFHPAATWSCLPPSPTCGIAIGGLFLAEAAQPLHLTHHSWLLPLSASAHAFPIWGP